MDILEALHNSKQVASEKERSQALCDDGLLPVIDAVFETTMRELGFDKEDRDEWMLEPAEMRHIYIAQWGSGKWKI